VSSQRLEIQDEKTGYYTWDVIENLVTMDYVCADFFEFLPCRARHGVPIEGILDKVDACIRERVAREIYDALIVGDYFETEYPLNVADGTLRWIHVTGRMIMDNDNVPVRSIGTMRDITANRLPAANHSAA
jgi:PAS domain-containing protein